MNSIAIKNHQGILMAFFDKEADRAINDEQTVYILAPVLNMINSEKSGRFDRHSKNSPPASLTVESSSGNDV